MSILVKRITTTARSTLIFLIFGFDLLFIIASIFSILGCEVIGMTSSVYDTFFYHGAHCHFYLIYIFHKKSIWIFSSKLEPKIQILSFLDLIFFLIQSTIQSRTENQVKILFWTLSFQRNFVACFDFIAIHNFHITLSGGNTFVGHYALDSADICSCCAL